MKAMKRLTIGAVVFAITTLLSINTFASEHDAWITDYKQAKQLSAKTGKPIFALFTGSDWCMWCVKLHKEVLQQKVFLKYAKDNFILLELDYPANKELPKELREQNDKLALQYKIQGFPTVIILDKNGHQLHRTGYIEGGAENFVEVLKTLSKK
jgi:protein disulfide-isomerase